MVWVKFAGFIFVVMLVILLINLWLKKIFKIENERKGLFPFNHINKSHLRTDLSINIVAAVAYILSFYLIVSKGYSVNIFLLSVIIFTVINHIVQAVFECKYSQNPKRAILAISEMSIMVIALIIVIQFDLFNLLIS